MFNLKNLVNAKIVALTAVAGLTPLIAQSALAESTKINSSFEQFQDGLLITQGTTNPGTSPTTNPGTSPTTNPGNSPTNRPGTSPTNNPGNSPTTNPNQQRNSPSQPLNRGDNSNELQRNSPDTNRGVTTEMNDMENQNFTSPNPQINNEGVTNSPNNPIENEPGGFIGVPAR
jgi:hypothetical protein